MTARFDSAAFDARLTALNVGSAELAEILGVDTDTVAQWRAGRGAPDAAERVRMRPLASDAPLLAAVERIRTRRTQSVIGGGRTDWPTPPGPRFDGGRPS